MHNNALLVIDYSNDFVDDKGALTCGEAGQALDTHIVKQIEKALYLDEFIFICNDEHKDHDRYDPEALLFPPHNIKGTWGAELYGKSGEMLRELLAAGNERVIYLPKTRFSAFFATPLDAMLRARKVHGLTVTGVCTDICVLHTVIDAIYKHYSVSLVENCCATCMPHGQEWAIAHMRDCLGAEII